jgi:hypothetical protein
LPPTPDVIARINRYKRAIRRLTSAQRHHTGGRSPNEAATRSPPRDRGRAAVRDESAS